MHHFMDSIRQIENAPVAQMVLTISFAPVLSGLTMVDIVDLFGQYRDRYPFFQHLPIAQAMTASELPVATIASHGSTDMPRVMFGAKDLQYSIYFQFDRLSLSWVRQAPIGSPDTYPGFQSMLAKFLSEIETLRAWVKVRKLPDIAPQVAELAYMNVFAVEVDGVKRRLSDRFTFFNNPRGAPMSSFVCAWTERLDDENPSEGYVNATAQFRMLNDGLPGIGFELLSLADLNNLAWQDSNPKVTQMHDKIEQIFSGSIHPDVFREYAR